MNEGLQIRITFTCLLFKAFLIYSSLICTGQTIENEEFHRQRREMVQQQIIGRGIENQYLLNAFYRVPRHIFVPIEFRKHSYVDGPLPIGYKQTISQPYIVAFMTEILKPHKKMRVLEIGTGSGYQAAILSILCKEVYSIEIIDSLAIQAKALFVLLGYQNIKVKIDDGYQGWKEFAPYDAIIVTCAPTKIPAPLLEQLAEGGKMIIPSGAKYYQKLYLIEKINGKIKQTESIPVRFVPMIRNDKSNY